MEFEFDVGDRKLFAQRWKVPDGTPIRAKILFNHGLNDHAGRYDHFFGDFAKSGYEVTSYDQRGQGKSVKRWFDTGATDNKRVFEDLDKIIEFLFEENADDRIDYILGGHSNGGGLTLYYSIAGKYRKDFTSFFCIHPWVGPLHPKARPARVLIWLVGFLAKFAPWLKIPLALDAEDMCNDEELIAQNKADKLIMKWVSIGQLFGSFTRASKVLDKSFASQYDPCKPILFLAGKDDKIVDYKSVQQAYDANPSKDKTIMINEGKHEVFRHVKDERDKFRDEILEWLDRHTSSPVSSAKSTTTKT